MRRVRWYVRSLAVLGFGLVWPQTAWAQDFQWQGSVGAGRMIEVKGINGGIRAVAASGDEVQVTAVIHERRRGDADDIEFEVLEHADGVTVCAMYPTPRRERRPNECRPGSGGRMSTQDIDVEVDFTVRVPANTNADARLSVVSGVPTSDFPIVETSPGIWEATLGAGGSLISLSAVSGNVTLRGGG